MNLRRDFERAKGDEIQRFNPFRSQETHHQEHDEKRHDEEGRDDRAGIRTHAAVGEAMMLNMESTEADRQYEDDGDDRPDAQLPTIPVNPGEREIHQRPICLEKSGWVLLCNRNATPHL